MNVFDLVNVNSGGGYGTGATSDWHGGDFDYDGVTNVFDLVGVNTAGAYGVGNYLPSAGASQIAAAVPEPTSWLPIAAAAGLAIGLGRRRA